MPALCYPFERVDEQFDIVCRPLLLSRGKMTQVGLWDYDIDADILICDSRWYDLLQLEFGSVRRIADFRAHIHPDDVAFATAVDPGEVSDMIARDERYHNDFRIIRADGVVRRWRSVACLLFDPAIGHRRAVGCVTDITDLGEADAGIAGAFPGPPEAPSGSKEDRGAAALTARELECLRWVSMGKTAWETATIMGRSQRTIEFHLVNAARKLNAINKIHAVVIAVRMGLI